MIEPCITPFVRRPPKAPFKPRVLQLQSGPLRPSDEQAKVAAHEEASALCTLGLCDDAHVHFAGAGKYFVHGTLKGELVEWSTVVSVSNEGVAGG